MYCGHCGCFYSPGCPRRPDGVCQPAPNPHDEQHVKALAAIAEANASIAAMQVANAACKYAPEDFDQIVAQMREAVKP